MEWWLGRGWLTPKCGCSLCKGELCLIVSAVATHGLGGSHVMFEKAAKKLPFFLPPIFFFEKINETMIVGWSWRCLGRAVVWYGKAVHHNYCLLLEMGFL